MGKNKDEEEQLLRFVFDGMELGTTEVIKVPNVHCNWPLNSVTVFGFCPNFAQPQITGGPEVTMKFV